MQKGRVSRRDKLIKQQRHDTYREKGKWPEPTICSECSSIYENGRWSWGDLPRGANRVLCPACQRIADRYPAGYIEMEGDFLREHKEEIMNLVRNEEGQEKNEHPMERIMSLSEEEGRVSITTTGIHIARRIGESLSRAYQGDFSFQYGDGEKIIRVNWRR